MTRDQIIQAIVSTTSGCGIDSTIALAQINQESSFNPSAVSPTGVQGLAQFTLATWNSGCGGPCGSGPRSGPGTEQANIDAYCNYMGRLLNRFGGDYYRALMAYNGGSDPAYASKILAAAPSWAGTVASITGVTPAPISTPEGSALPSDTGQQPSGGSAVIDPGAILSDLGGFSGSIPIWAVAAIALGVTAWIVLR